MRLAKIRSISLHRWSSPTCRPPATTPWPMGDLVADDRWPAEIDRTAMEEAIDIGFGPPEAMTLGLLVTYKGEIIGERYGDGIDMHTPLESWSMGKSLTGALMGVLIQRGDYELWQSAPIPEWQADGDPRQAIRIGDIMRMSSGIRIRAPQDPDYEPELGYPDHVYFYTGTTNSFAWAATRPQQWEPNTVGRYRNSDPVLTNYLIRLAVEGRGEDYHSFPQRSLFDKIGIRNAIMETDIHGNFLTQGYEFLPPRDWARLGNLYLQDGVWNGERILPEGYVDYARQMAPAWEADGRLIYGGAFLWLNGNGGWPLPTTAYGMRGAGGQSATMVPTHGLVVVRLGKYTGSSEGWVGAQPTVRTSHGNSATGRRKHERIKKRPTLNSERWTFLHRYRHYLVALSEALRGPRVPRETFQVFPVNLCCVIPFARGHQDGTEIVPHGYGPLRWFAIQKRIFQPHAFPQFLYCGVVVASCGGD